MELTLPHSPFFTADGVVYQAKYAGHVFKKQGFGNLIITASISAHIVNVPIDQPVSSTSIFPFISEKQSLIPHLHEEIPQPSHPIPQLTLTPSPHRSTTPPKPPCGTSAGLSHANGEISLASTLSLRVSSTRKWAPQLLYRVRRIG